MNPRITESEGSRLHCFFCLEDSNSNVYTSLRALRHYLDPRRTEAAWEAGIVTCATCSKLLGKFHNLFNLWEELGMKLSLCAEEIGTRFQFETKACQNRTMLQKTRKRIQKKCNKIKLKLQLDTNFQVFINIYH